jgi:RimJ/RimL family protein N-acetyltransferase
MYPRRGGRCQDRRVELPVVPILPVRTDRLVLRPFTPEDVEPLYAFHSDPAAVRYVPYPPRTRDQVVEVLRRKVASTALQAEGSLLELAVVRSADQSLIGDVLLAVRSVQHQTLEVGYIFAPAAAGRGYATEAVRALVDLAFTTVGARRVVARVDERNVRSSALLERLGFRREARQVENEWFKDELSTELDYALLSREWPPAGAARPA